VVSKAKAEGPLAKPGNPTGHNQHTPEEERKGADGTVPHGSNQASYLARRLLRDAPEIFAELEHGEHKSVRAAAIAAEIVKVPSALEVAQRAFLKLSVREKHESGTWLVNGY
jgi:hypothetical protein